MAQTMTNFDSALKEFYQPGIRSELNNTNMLLSQVDKNTEDFEGRRAVLSLQMTRSGGVGARSDSSGSVTLPTAGNQGFAEERISVRHLYGHIKLTGPVMRASKGDAGSFGRALDTEIKGMVNDVKKDLNRQLFGTSDGVVATCGTTSNSTTLQLSTTLTTATIMRYFDIGMVIDVGTVASPTADASARTITAIDSTNHTLTISGAGITTTNATDFVFRSGNGGSGSSQMEVTGLQTIVDSTGTLFNVNPTTYPRWSAYESSNSGTNRAVSENLFATAIHEVKIASGDDIDAFVANYGVHRAFANLLQATKRFPNTLELKGGYVGLEIAAGGRPIPLVPDLDCPENIAFGLNFSHLIEFVQADWTWADTDGAVLSRVSGTDDWEAFIYKDMELATDKRNAFAKIADLTTA